MADKKRCVFVVGLVAGAATTWLLVTKKGKSVRGRFSKSGAAGDEELVWQDEQAGGDADANARSEALRQKIEDTRRRLREQVGLPPEE